MGRRASDQERDLWGFPGAGRVVTKLLESLFASHVFVKNYTFVFYALFCMKIIFHGFVLFCFVF